MEQFLLVYPALSLTKSSCCFFSYSVTTMAHLTGFNVDPVVQDIKEALKRERVAHQAAGWSLICFPTPAIRRMLVVGVGMAVAQQAVGIDAIQYYLIDVLEKSGIKSEKSRLAVLMLLGVLKLTFVVIGGKLFDRRGRKPLILVSLAGTWIDMCFAFHDKVMPVVTGWIKSFLARRLYDAF
jgi:hypothetical protein